MSSQELPGLDGSDSMEFSLDEPITILNQSFSTNEVGSSFKTVADENSQEEVVDSVPTQEPNAMFSYFQ
jgi:hypothetical protein